MADIFISYAQSERDRIQPIAEALRDGGYNVFWDPQIKGGQRYRDVIDDAMTEARCVVVCWSRHSVVSDWVIDEAEEARSRNILVPALLDDVLPPRGFRQIQMTDLTKWRGTRDHPAFLELIDAVAAKAGGSEGREVAAPRQPAPTHTTSGAKIGGRLWLRSLAFSLILALGAVGLAAVTLVIEGTLRETEKALNIWQALTVPFEEDNLLSLAAFGGLAFGLGFWLRYMIFLSDQLLGSVALRLFSGSLISAFLFSLIVAVPLTPWVVAGTNVSWISVLDASFSPDGTRVVTAVDDGTARLWNVETGEESAVLQGHKNLVRRAAFSPMLRDGTLLVVTASEDGTARVWDAGTGGEVHVLRGHAYSVLRAVFSPVLAGEHLLVATASADDTARLWDAKTGQEIAVLAGHDDWVRSVAFSPLLPDGRLLVATASDDATARLWDAEAGTEIAVLAGHEDWVRSVAFSPLLPDGRLLVATASDDGTARVWDSVTGTEIAVLAGHEDYARSVAFSPLLSDGSLRVVTASDDNTARVWHAETGDEVAVLRHDDWVNSAAFSPVLPDGSLLVVTASDDGTAQVWDAETGDVVSVLRGQVGGWVSRAAFSPVQPHGAFSAANELLVVTASDDGAARVWDAALGVERWVFDHSPAPALGFLPKLPLPPLPGLDLRPSVDSEWDEGTLMSVLTVGLLFVAASVLLAALFRRFSWERRAALMLFGPAVAYFLAVFLTNLPILASILWLVLGIAISPLIATIRVLVLLLARLALADVVRSRRDEARA